MKKLMVVVMFSTILTGCVTTQPGVSSSNPNANNSKTGAPAMQSFGLQTVDFEYAAKQAVEEFLSSSFATQPGGKRYVVSMGDVTNDTTLNISTKNMTDRMKNLMKKSNKFIFTAAVGTEKTKFVGQSQQLNKSAQFDKSTTADVGSAIAPDVEMSGEIRQRTNVSADRKQQSLEYEFAFRVVSTNGLELFDTIVPIDKQGSNQNFTW